MPGAMRRDPNVVVRRIYFYRVDVGRDPNTGAPISVAAPTLLRPLEALDFGDGSAYMSDDNSDTCGWVDRLAAPSRLRVADVRRSYLPQVELRGALSALTLAADAGLAEEVHVVFYENNIVGSDFNFYGPRMSRVARFLQDRADSGPIGFEYLLRGDVVAQLDALEDIHLFDLRIAPTYLDEIAQLDESVAAMFRGALSLGETGRVEVILRPVPFSRAPLPHRVREALRALAGRSVVRDAADVFRTSGRGPNGRIRGLDLLRDELVLEREVRRRSDGSRALDSDSVYNAIDGAYHELRVELERAHGASEQ